MAAGGASSRPSAPSAAAVRADPPPSPDGAGSERATGLRVAAAGLLAAYVALSVYVLWRSAVLAPFSDEFDWTMRWYRLQADHRWLAYLTDPHNLNRLAWTRLAIALDMGALGGTNAPLILSGAVGLAVMACVLGMQAARAAPAGLKAPVGALATMLTLTAGNILDASTPIYVTYVHAAVFAVLALVLSEGARNGALGWRGLGAIACATASAFGSGAGLALWPVMAWGALRRRDWPWLAVVSVAGAVFVGLYLKDQGGGAGSAALPALHDPKSAAILALGFLTLPWTRLVLAVAWGLGGAIAAAAAAAVLAKGGPQASPAERVACGLILFTLGTAAMAGLGRSGVQDPYNVPLRYGLLVTPLHVGALMLLAPYARDGRRLARPLLVAALVATFALDVVFAVKAVEAGDIIRDTVADFHAGRRTERMLTIVHPDLRYAEAVSARLRRDGLYQHELHLKAAPPAR